MPKAKGKHSASDRDLEEPKVTGALARGLRILNVIRNIGRPVSSSEISQEAGLDASTTHRLLQVLDEHGYVLRDDNAKRYFASPKLLFPLSIYSPLNELRREAARAADRFRDESGHTTGFVLYCMKERILIEISSGANSLSPAYDTWLDSPLHASASGKILLLSLSPGERKARMGEGPYDSYTPFTITDPKALEADLEQAQKNGYVVAADDYFEGLTAIGAALWTDEGACIGCMFINGRSKSVPENEYAALGTALKSAADLFSIGTPSLHVVGRMFGARTAAGLPRMRTLR
ncbi:MAG: IclR family transcriptional regulator [Hyphomicrobiales bacterium]